MERLTTNKKGGSNERRKNTKKPRTLSALPCEGSMARNTSEDQPGIAGGKARTLEKHKESLNTSVAGTNFKLWDHFGEEEVLWMKSIRTGRPGEKKKKKKKLPNQKQQVPRSRQNERRTTNKVRSIWPKQNRETNPPNKFGRVEHKNR